MGKRSGRSALQQLGDQVAETSSVEVGLSLEPLQDVPRRRRRDALRAAAEQISCCDSSKCAPTGLRECSHQSISSGLVTRSGGYRRAGLTQP